MRPVSDTCFLSCGDIAAPCRASRDAAGTLARRPSVRAPIPDCLCGPQHTRHETHIMVSPCLTYMGELTAQRTQMGMPKLRGRRPRKRRRPKGGRCGEGGGGGGKGSKDEGLKKAAEEEGGVTRTVLQPQSDPPPLRPPPPSPHPPLTEMGGIKPDSIPAHPPTEPEKGSSKTQIRSMRPEAGRASTTRHRVCAGVS